MTEGALDNHNEWVNNGYIPYDYLRKSWQKVVLDLLKKWFPSNQAVTKLINDLYKRYPKGFEDPFGLDEDMEIVLFKCLDCHGTDEVPEYIIGEFSLDKKRGEEVELHCPHCNGTMIRARNIPSD